MSKMNVAPKNSENSWNAYRVLSVVLAAVACLAIFLPVQVVSGNAVTAKFFGLFTALSVGTAGVLATISRYLFIGLMAATAVLGVLGTVNEEKTVSLFRIEAILFLLGCGGYAISLTSAALAATGKWAFDIITIILTLAGLGVYIWLVCQEIGSEIVKNVSQFALTTVYSVLMALVCGMNVFGQVSPILGVLSVLFFFVILANLAFECIRLQYDGNLGVDRIRFIGALSLSVVLFVFSLINDTSIFAIISTLVSVVLALTQIELNAKQIKASEKKAAYEASMARPTFDTPLEAPMAAPYGRPMAAPMAAAVEPAANAMNGFRVEEYAEACPYEGGPVAGVEMAEEVNPTFKPAEINPDQVYTAGYDFYNCKSFDAFIATLDMEERNQFTELFILKYKGVMPEIPDYVVGGDNREFFRMIFIYLGQYRDRIPTGLLTKIYNYSIKIS